MNLKAIFLGLMLGFAIPAVFMGLLQLGLMMFNQNLSSDIAQAGWLFGVALNAILVKLLKNKKEFLSRGILLASFFIFIAWVVFFVVLESKS